MSEQHAFAYLLEGSPDNRRPVTERRIQLRAEEELLLLPKDRLPARFELGKPESVCYLLSGEHCPQLGAELIMVNCEVFQADPTRGWVAIGGVHNPTLLIGTVDSPALELGQGVSYAHGSVSLLDMGIVVADNSEYGTWVETDARC
jgi:hypothetical protein